MKKPVFALTLIAFASTLSAAPADSSNDRFNGVEVPRGTPILESYIQFTTEDDTFEPTSLVIQGQAADNPPAFSSATVMWAP